MFWLIGVQELLTNHNQVFQRAVIKCYNMSAYKFMWSDKADYSASTNYKAFT